MSIDKQLFGRYILVMAVKLCVGILDFGYLTKKRKKVFTLKNIIS